jgi:hypothetical protein
VEGHGEIFKVRFQRERLASLFVRIVGARRKLGDLEDVFRVDALPFLNQRRRITTQKRHVFHEGRIVQQIKSTA